MKKQKLLRKASTNFIVISSILFVITAIALFFYTRFLLDDEIEEELNSQITFVEQNIEKGNLPISIEPILLIERIKEKLPTTLKDTLIYDPGQRETETFRELSKSTETLNGIFNIKVRRLVIESEDIIVGIIVSFLSILAIAFFILFIVNRSRNEIMWQPFFSSLKKLEDFSFETKESIVFESSNIHEFHDLNTRLNTLIKKINSDYNNLKQFTEDMSHESQTPLAIMQAKIENIINQSDTSEKNYKELNSVQKNIKRLTLLNKRLILLAKIDNNQFSNAQFINLKNLIEEISDDFKEISQNTFSIEINPNAEVKIDICLAEILINNLISNAIKYGNPKSEIHIKASSLMLQVANFGKTEIEKPKEIFTRFYRESSNKNATGLGLSIIKKICDYYNYTPHYNFEDKKHIFRIDFKE